MPGEGRPFEKGRSANPAGRPKGARSKATLALEAILEGDAQAIVGKVVEMAKGGDAVALRLCLERLIPPRRDRHIRFALPPIETPADAVKANAAIVAAVAAGELTPSEGTDLGRLVDSVVKGIEAVELSARLTRLEAVFHERRT